MEPARREARSGTAPLIVYLARHGETDWNRERRLQGHTDTPLNDVGRDQARALAERLRAAGCAIARVGSSDLARARETARIVAARLGATLLEPDAALRERGFGAFEGLTPDECIARFPDAWGAYAADPRTCPPGGETHDAFGARMSAAVARVLSAARDGSGAISEGSRAPTTATLLVTHGGGLRLLLARSGVARPPHVPNGAIFRARLDDARDPALAVEPF